MEASLFVSEVTEVKKLSLVVLLVLLSACKEKLEGAGIRATITLASDVKATCVRFDVKNPSTHEVIKTAWVERKGDDLKVAILQGSLPTEVEISARPFRDGTCNAASLELKANGKEVTAKSSFQPDTIVVAELPPMAAGTDTDTDGYVSTSDGGEDCNDALGGQEVHPNQAEVCTAQVDLNCNGKKACEEDGCGTNDCIGDPAALALGLPAAPVKAGECTPGTVQLKDAKGSNAKAVSATTVNLTAAPTGGIAFYSDASCASSVTSVNIAAGTGSASFFFQGQATGLITVSAKSTNLTTAMQNIQVDPGVGNRLVFTTAPRTAVSNLCSAVVTVQSQDAQGNPKPVTASTPISLSATPNNGFTFYSDAGCNNAVTSATMASNTNSANFYFRGTVAGDVSVTVTAPSFTGISQVEKITPGPAKLIVVTGPATTQAGSCSTQGTITLQDAQGNATTATANTTINLTFAGKALTFSTTGACAANVTSVSIASGTGTAPFFYRGTLAGASTITAAGTGLTSGTLGVTITPGPASLLAYTTPLQTLSAGACSALTTVQLQDNFGNPAPVLVGTVVNLTAALPDGFQFFSGGGCSGAAVTAVTIPAGASDASFSFKGTRSGTVVVTAAVGSISKTQSETINPATATALVLSPTTLAVAAGACTPVTVQLQDTYGNLSNVNPAQTVTLAAAPPAGFTFHTASNCGSGPVNSVGVTANQSSATFYVKGTLAGTVTVTATDAPLTAATTTVTVSPGLPSKLGFRTTPQTVVSRACSSLTTVELQDSFGNLAPSASGTTINLTSSIGTVTFYSDSGCATQVTSVPVGAGQSSANFYFKDNAVGAETPNLMAAGTSLGSISQPATITPEPPTELAFLTAPQTVTAGACSGQVSVQTRAQGNPTAYSTATIVTPSGTGLSFFTNSNCTGPSATFSINANSSTTSFYFKGSTAGSITLTAHSGTLTDATQVETINAGVPSQGVFITPVLTTVAGVCSAALTVQSRDLFGNVAPTPTTVTLMLEVSGSPADPNFKFYSDPSCSTVVTTIPFNAGQSTASFYYRGELARSVNLAVTFGGSYSTPVQVHTITPGALNKLTFASSTPAQTLLAGACAKRTAERRDTFGNLVPDTSATIVTPSGSSSAEFFLDATCTSSTPTVSIDANTTSADFYFKGYTGGLNMNAPLTLTLASPGLVSATQINNNIVPLVRTGTCTLNQGQKTKSCLIFPAVTNPNRSLLVFQATAQSMNSDDTNVRCRITSNTGMDCDRGGTTGDANARWSIAEFPTTVVTQHLLQACTGATTNVPFGTPATQTQSFLMPSSERGVAGQGSDVSRLADMTSSTQAQIRKPGDCSNGDTNNLQVVDYPGSTVQRGQASMNSGVASGTVTLSSSVDTSRSILLYSYTFTGTGTKVCDRAVRGELTDVSTLTFSRGQGDTTNCTDMAISGISWEVVQFPVGTVVHQFTQVLAAGAASASITLPTAVDPTRTVVIAGGQWASGQVHGEGTHFATEAINEMRAQAYVTDSTHVTVSRESSIASAKFTIFVVQFKP